MLALMIIGCGPTLMDSKIQYVATVNAGTSTLNVLNILVDTNQITPKERAEISKVVQRFEVYRIKIRAAIDANTPVPVESLLSFREVLDELIIIQIQKVGVK